MTEDLLALASAIAERAMSGEDVEAVLTHEREFSAKAFEGEIETTSAAEPRGAGVRVFKGGRVGFAYTTDLGDEGLTAVVERARDNATHATPDEAVAPADPWRSPPPDVDGLVDPRASEVDPDAKARFALELEALTRGRDERVTVVEEAVYSDSVTDIAIAASNGIAGSYRRTDAWCYAVAIASQDDDTQVGFEFDLARGITGLDAPRVAARAVDRAVSVLGASKIPSTKLPVVFDPYTAGQFLGVVGRALTGEAVQKGRSLFAGRLGDAVASAALTLVDDGRAEGAPGAAPWDGEGVPTRRTEVIRAGTLASFLYDSTSARRDGVASTGNAARAGFKSAPSPAPSNLAFGSTGESREDVLGSVDRALLVQDFHGVHSGANPVSGDFSVGATGLLLEGGEPGRPIKEVTIAAPMLDVLRGIVAVASDLRWLPFGGSYGGATTLVEEMTVAGE